MHSRVNLASLTIALLFFTCLTCDLAIAQQETDEAVNDTSTVTTETVAVEEIASDAEVRRRLTSILQATDWFDEIDVESNQGVVILPFFGNATRKRVKLASPWRSLGWLPEKNQATPPVRRLRPHERCRAPPPVHGHANGLASQPGGRHTFLPVS